MVYFFGFIHADVLLDSCGTVCPENLTASPVDEGFEVPDDERCLSSASRKVNKSPRHLANGKIW